jgi:hypothetical protein
MLKRWIPKKTEEIDTFRDQLIRLSGTNGEDQDDKERIFKKIPILLRLPSCYLMNASRTEVSWHLVWPLVSEDNHILPQIRHNN